MRKVPAMPVLAFVLFAAACGDGPTALDTKARLRFFNATTGSTENAGFTTNGQFVSGSALPFGQSSQTCATVDSGATSFGFGRANGAGTGLSGVATATLNDKNLKAGVEYTVVAAGPATSPTLYLLDNTFTGTLTTSQAAVRFVNLAPGTGATPNAFVAWVPELAPNVPALATNNAVGAPTSYKTVGSGTVTFTVAQSPGLVMVIPSGSATVEDGSVNTLAIVPDAPGPFRVIVIPGC